MAVWRVPATITWPGNGSPGVNVWSVRTNEGSVVIDELDSALTALKAFYDGVQSYFVPGLTVSIGPDIVNRDTQEDQARPAKTSTSSGAAGAAAPVLQLCLSWRTSLRARRGMGRTFIGPLTGAAVESNGTPTAAAVTSVSNAAAALISASEGANGWAIGVWGLQSPGQYDERGVLVPGQPHVHRDILSYKIRDQFAVLRSRRD